MVSVAHRPGSGGDVDAWLATLASERPEDERALVERAARLAVTLRTERGAPEGDARDGRAVAAILDGLGLDAEALAAALLEDAVREDDADSVLGRVAREVGAGAAELLAGVVRMQSIGRLGIATSARGANERQAEQLKRLLISMVRDVRVVLVALAVRLHEVRSVRDRDRAERERIGRETLDVHAPLASRLGIWQFKWELEDLAFRALEPETYATVARRLAERRADRERWIARVVTDIERELARVGVAAKVHGRPKHIYGIWKKMQRKGVDFDEIFDARAVRVLVDDLPACYTVLGVVHGLWHHIPREFDDYIANPKPNRYQSLHTAVIGPGGQSLEIQIRTHEMHAHAELGVAAHWRYKEGAARRERDVDTRIAWLRQLLEWKEEGEASASADDLVGRLSSELLDERVYVVTPRGEILDLPAGATPLDFAYHIHTDVGHRCRGARVNGSIVPLTSRLRSGDRVEVLTSGRAGPSRDWLSPHLGYLRTSRARAKVRQWFKQQDRERNLADGQGIFDRELKRLGVGAVDRESLCRRFNFVRFEDLLAAIGRGDVSTGQLAGALQPFVPAPPQPPPRKRPRRSGAERNGAVHVRGVGDLMTSMARCCRPVPPDPIVGYITRGRGVTVHRGDCGNVLRLDGADRARLVDVEWSDEGERCYSVRVAIAGYDRAGLLRDITTAVAAEGVNIVTLDTRSRDEDHVVHAGMTIEVADLAQLSRVLDRVSQVANVIEATRTG